jgi:uncharacterized membrane protein YeaQ/YmgE (transglycosylase-associated protein family)
MSLVAWAFLGIIVAFATNALAGKRGLGLGYDVLLGIAGAISVGFAVDWLAGPTRTGVNPWSLTASGFGAGLVLAFSASLRRRNGRSGRTLSPAPKPRPIRR